MRYMVYSMWFVVRGSLYMVLGTWYVVRVMWYFMCYVLHGILELLREIIGDLFQHPTTPSDAECQHLA